jgi:hypothetical protein
MFKPLSFEDAVKLFQQWGFQVEPGPRPEEVTLILEGPDYRTYSVYEARMLPQIAAVALQVRWQSGSMTLNTWRDNADIDHASADVGRASAESTADLETVPFPVGAASLLRA